MKITIHLHNGITFLLLVVPLNTSDFKIVSEDGNFLTYKTINGYTDWVDIPSGNYTIIGKADALTEEQAMEMVDYTDLGAYTDEDEYYEYRVYFDYESQSWGAETATDSLYSLLRSHNLQPETTLILKQST